MPGWEKKAQNYADIDTFPFLSIETDGSPFPQLVEANMEAFILQAKRVHEHLLSLKKHKLNKKTTSYPVRWYDIVLGNGKILSSERSKTPK
jgi:hypothetical protein